MVSCYLFCMPDIESPCQCFLQCIVIFSFAILTYFIYGIVTCYDKLYPVLLDRVSLYFYILVYGIPVSPYLQIVRENDATVIVIHYHYQLLLVSIEPLALWFIVHSLELSVMLLVILVNIVLCYLPCQSAFPYSCFSVYIQSSLSIPVWEYVCLAISQIYIVSSLKERKVLQAEDSLVYYFLYLVIIESRNYSFILLN